MSLCESKCRLCQSQKKGRMLSRTSLIFPLGEKCWLTPDKCEPQIWELLRYVDTLKDLYFVPKWVPLIEAASPFSLQLPTKERSRAFPEWRRYKREIEYCRIGDEFDFPVCNFFKWIWSEAEIEPWSSSIVGETTLPLPFTFQQKARSFLKWNDFL